MRINRKRSREKIANGAVHISQRVAPDRLAGNYRTLPRRSWKHTSRLELACSSAPKRVVDFVNNVRGADGTVVEVATVETLESLLATGDRVELNEDVALAVGVDSNVDDLAVLLVTLGLDLNLEILDPVVAPVALFPVVMLV